MRATRFSVSFLLLLVLAAPMAVALGDVAQTLPTLPIEATDDVAAPATEELVQPYSHRSVDALFAVAQDPARPDLEGLFLDFMRDQGMMQTFAGADAADAQEPDRPQRPPPPGREMKPQQLVCDLDGDDVLDTIGNEQQLGWYAVTRLRAASGADGETLWRREHMVGPSSIVQPPYDGSFPTGTNGIDTREHGQPMPTPAKNAQENGDLDGDGVCDVVAINFVPSRPTVIGCYVEMDYVLQVRGISGATGEDLWRTDLPGSFTYAGECLVTGDFVLEYTDFPTGFLPYQSPSGPKVLIKTSDIRMTYVCDPSCLPPPAYHENKLLYYSAHVTERLRLLDGSDGSLLWRAEITEPDNARMTNIAWIAGVADLANDAEPEILLHHLTLTTPRGKEHRSPITGEEMMQYARGMRMTAVRGELETEDRVLWTQVIHDPLAVQPRVDLEENDETLVWTYGSITGDLSGDGKPTPVASYIVIERNAGGTSSGRYRTYFHPLDGEDGAKLWGEKGVRKQGWGFMEAIHEDERAEPRVAIGMVDYPTAPPAGGQFPPKFIRLEVAKGSNGATLWGYEKLFAQNSYVIYNTALHHFKTTLAPHDWTGDGWRDLVTPSQYVAPESGNQVLLAASSHTYEVLAAADGSTLRTLSAWGPDGQVVYCGDDNPYITVVSGHPRRIDVTRFDVLTGEQLWRQAIWNNPAPRAAVSGTDVMGVTAGCSEDDTGRTQISVNMVAVSAMRGFEVIAVTGFLAESEDHPATWLDPWLRGEPAMSSIFEPHVPEIQPSLAERGDELALGGAIGAIAAVGALLARRRGPSVTIAAAFAVVVLLVGSGALAPLAAALPTDTGSMLLDGLPEDEVAPTPPSTPADPAAEPVAAAVAPSGPSAPATSAPPQASAPPLADMRLDGVVPSGNGAKLPATPYLQFLAALADLEEEGAWTPQAHLALAQQYFHSSGFDVPPPRSPDRFEEGATVSFTRDIGDVDGDGIDDLLLDEYCVQWDVCKATAGDPIEWYLDRTAGMGTICGPQHHLWTVSGRDGSVIWNTTMDRPTHQFACALSFVVDVIPLPDGGNGVLTYSISITGLFAVNAIEHEFRFLDAATGEVIWTIEETGAYQGIYGGLRGGYNILINPIVQVSGTGGVQPVDANSTAPALFLQSVGFQVAYVDTWPVAPPGSPGTIILVNGYKPIEWAAGIDIATGEDLWRQDTFQPEVGRNQLPVALDGPSFMPNSYRLFMSPVVEYRYWEHEACCFDSTGDGVPDLVYRVYEWTDTPLYNPDGPIYPLFTGHITTFDGATGQKRIDEVVVGDPVVPFQLLTQTIGDADGDGNHDILLHIRHIDFDYKHTLSMRSGADGSEIWRIESPRELRVFVMGDATGDGGNDLLIVDWYGHDLAVRGQLDRYTKDRDEPQGLPLNLISGADGTGIWEALTFAAPVDAAFMLEMFQRNGIPDLDGDGVGDLFLDDPLFLGDQTIVHRQRLVSGRDLAPMYTIEAPGAFAMPVRLPDVTGDGIDDIGMMNGDLSDLWLTVHNGTSGDAMWSTRLLSVRVTNYVSAYPNLRVHPIGNVNQTHDDFVVNYHLSIANFGFFGYTQTVTPQILGFEGPNGTIDWAFPRAGGQEAVASLILGPSPASQLWLDASTPPEFSLRTEANAYLVSGGPASAAFAVAFLSVFGTGWLASRKRRIKDEVPDLEDL